MLFGLGIIFIIVGVCFSSETKKYEHFGTFIILLGVASIVGFIVGNMTFYDLTSEVQCQTGALKSFFDYQEGDNIYYLTVVDDNFNFETTYYRINEDSITEYEIDFETGKVNFPVVIKRSKGRSNLVRILCAADPDWIIDGYTVIVPENYFAFGKLENISRK